MLCLGIRLVLRICKMQHERYKCAESLQRLLVIDDPVNLVTPFVGDMRHRRRLAPTKFTQIF